MRAYRRPARTRFRKPLQTGLLERELAPSGGVTFRLDRPPVAVLRFERLSLSAFCSYALSQSDVLAC